MKPSVGYIRLNAEVSKPSTSSGSTQLAAADPIGAGSGSFQLPVPPQQQIQLSVPPQQQIRVQQYAQHSDLAYPSLPGKIPGQNVDFGVLMTMMQKNTEMMSLIMKNLEAMKSSQDDMKAAMITREELHEAVSSEVETQLAGETRRCSMPRTH